MSAQLKVKDKRSLYIGCIPDCVGEWLDLDNYTLEEMDAKAKEIIKSRPYPSDEYGIADQEGFGKLLDSWFPSLERAYEIHDLLNEAETEGIDIDVFISFLENQDEYEAREIAGQIEKFEQSYQGEFESLEYWAMNEMDELGDLDQTPLYIQNHFDFESYARDEELNGNIYSIRLNHVEHVFKT